MKLIDPHIHTSSRTTDDLEAMQKAGIVAVIEPAFWLGQPRTNAGSFIDYFSSLLGWERFRAAQFGIHHYAAIGLNSKEANDEVLAKEVIDILPRFLCKEGVVALGEIGLDDGTKAEEKALRTQLELAKEIELPVIVHTPHRNKKAGTIRCMEIIKEHNLSPEMVIIDHNNEETIESVIDEGFWIGFTIYPKTKMGKERMANIVLKYGTNKIIVNSSADWGVSNPLSVPHCANMMIEKGVSENDIKTVCYQNAIDLFSKSGQFIEDDWKEKPKVDQRQLFSGNSVLRGQTAIVE